MNGSQHNLNQVLLEVVQSLTADLDLPVVLSKILEQLALLVDYDNASIMLLDGDHLDSAAQRSIFPVRATPLAVNVSTALHLDEVISQQHPVLINDTDSDPRWIKRPGNEGIRSWLGIPLIVEGQSIGMLNISKAQPAFFGDDNVRIATTFAGFAAVALSNAGLFHRLEDALARRAQVETELQQERALLAERVAEQTTALRVANQEMARASRMKDEFLAAMSHELHTPLNVIISMTDLLREQAFGDVSPGQQQALDRIDQHSRRLLSLISDVLDVARIESGSLELLAHHVDVDALCRTCLRQVDISGRHLEVELAVEDSLPGMVGDEKRLRQILGNLLSNAVKFTEDGGAIKLEAVHDREHECLALTVCDTGIGIDEADLHRLFQPFVQLDSSLSRRYEGTGLGLTLIHRLTALHGGSLAIESSKVEGSHFTVRIPWMAVMEEDTTNQRGAADAAFVLMLSKLERADDLLAADLHNDGFRVESIVQGADLQIDEPPDLLVVSGHPPLHNIVRTVGTLRANRLLAATPIIVLTTLHLPGYREAILQAGATAYAIKPLTGAALEHLLREHHIPNHDDHRLPITPDRIPDNHFSVETNK